METVHGTTTSTTLSSIEDHHDEVEDDEIHVDEPISPPPPPPDVSNSPKRLVQQSSPKQSPVKPEIIASTATSTPVDEKVNSEPETAFNPITVSVDTVAFIPSSYEEPERPSDVYSLHSDGIPEHDEEEDKIDTDEKLEGDGSKPVGCTSCVVM